MPFCRLTLAECSDRTSSNAQRFEQRVHLAVAVAELVEADAYLIEQCEMKVGQRRGFVETDVPSALHAAGSAPGHDDREVRVVVHVRVAHAAAVEVQRVVEERSVAVLRRGELAEELGEEGDVELVDLRKLGDLGRVVAVVG